MKNIFIITISSFVREKKMTAPVAYNVTGELLIVGKKSIVCRCPRSLRRLIEADVQYAPVADYYNVVKPEDDKTNSITLFNMRLKDRLFASSAGELPKMYDVVFELPLSFNRWVTLGDFGPEVELGVSEEVDSFFAEVISLLRCWEQVMKSKLSTDQVQFYVPETWRLKYPWKKMSAEDYFAKFNPETDRHKVTIGLGYHNLKEAKLGISLQLSCYPATPPKRSKKRKQDSISEGASEEAVVSGEVEVEDMKSS